MVNINKTCFVPGCKTGYGNTRKENSRQGLKNKSVFKPTVTPLKSDLTLQDVRVGSPLKKVLISKFCHSWLLHLHEQILSLWSHLKEIPANRKQQGNSETVKKVTHLNSEDEVMLSQVKSDIDDLQEKSYGNGKEVNQNVCAPEGNSSHNGERHSMVQEHILKILTDDTRPCFTWCDKMKTGSFGSGLEELLTTLKGVEENGNLLIIKAFPLLTRVEVGIIYLLSQLFHELWFMWQYAEVYPGDERYYSILLNRRHSCGENQMKIQHFLKKLSELVANEERKSSPQTLLAVVPISILCEQDFYECIVRMNHIILKNRAKELLSDCSDRIIKQ